MVRAAYVLDLRRVGSIFTLAMLLATLLVFAESRPAHATSCYGDSCEGQDPYATGCGSRYEKDNGSTYARFIIYTPAGSPEHMYTGFYTYLWWSNACNASWTEVYADNWGAFNVWIQEFSTSYCTGFVNERRYAGSAPYDIQYGTDIYSPMASEVTNWDRAYVVQDPLGPRYVSTYPCV